jgi:hypothetical protein
LVLDVLGELVARRETRGTEAAGAAGRGCLSNLALKVSFSCSSFWTVASKVSMGPFSLFPLAPLPFSSMSSSSSPFSSFFRLFLGFFFFSLFILYYRGLG